MKKILVVVDMQNDFVGGALGSAQACAIVPAVAEKISCFDGERIYATFDTHFENYSDTLEGKKLPVAHCIKGTRGQGLHEKIEAALKEKNWRSIEKYTFGTFEIAEELKMDYPDEDFSFEVCGLCTDICVISNVLILRAAFPDAEITLDARCCAGVSKESHEAALTAMKCCQIDVIGEEEDVYHV